MSEPRKKDYPCLKCTVHVKKNEEAIQCNQCDLWVHRACSGIVNELWVHLVDQSESEGRIFWSCRACKTFAAKFHASLGKIEKRLTAVEAKSSGNEGAITQVADDLKKVDTTVQKLEEKVKAFEESPRGGSGASASAVLKEIKERKERQCIAIVHGLPEPSFQMKDSKDRMEADLAKVQAMIAELEVADAEVSFSKRLGPKPKAATDKPRPLCVGFRSDRMQENFLQGSGDQEDWGERRLVERLSRA